jgi:NAD-dependent DNA ligase
VGFFISFFCRIFGKNKYMSELKPFMPTHCPVCEHALTIRKGTGDGVLKLMCLNEDCDGSSIRQLQKGIDKFKIRGLGPALILKLYNAGLNCSVDLFDPTICNREKLIASGEFVTGKTLDNLLESITVVKELPINLAIHSLQIMVEKEDDKEGYISIGDALSLQIGKLLSGLPVDFTGLSKKVRAEIQDPTSELYQNITQQLQRFETLGIKIKKFEAKKVIVTETKSLSKKVFLGNTPPDFNKEEWLQKLGWSEVNLEECDLIVVLDPKADTVQELKMTGKQLLSFPQVKMLFMK